MNFEEFKKRYEAKLLRAGLPIPAEGDEDYQAFQDQMATIYVGLTIYSEFQREEAEKQLKKEMQRKPQIYVPENGIKH